MTRPLENVISIRQLRLVTVLGRELNLSRTAEVLCTTQPAVSRSLAQLEDTLGARLFFRDTKRVTATEAGLSMMQHAQRVLAELEVAQEELASIRTGLKGELHIGVFPAFSYDLLGRSIARVREIFPNASIVVETNGSSALYEGLVGGRFDLILSHAESSVDLGSVEVKELYVDHCKIVLSKSHPLADGRILSHQDLANYPWILPSPDTPLRPKLNRLISVYREKNLLEGRDIQTDSLLIALSLVRRAGMILATTAQHANAYAQSEDLRVFDTQPELLSGPFCAFWIHSGALKSSAHALLNYLTEECLGQ